MKTGLFKPEMKILNNQDVRLRAKTVAGGLCFSNVVLELIPCFHELSLSTSVKQEIANAI